MLLSPEAMHLRSWAQSLPLPAKAWGNVHTMSKKIVLYSDKQSTPSATDLAIDGSNPQGRHPHLVAKAQRSEAGQTHSQLFTPSPGVCTLGELSEPLPV